jgi:hypothetical protein
MKIPVITALTRLKTNMIRMSKGISQEDLKKSINNYELKINELQSIIDDLKYKNLCLSKGVDLDYHNKRTKNYDHLYDAPSDPSERPY